MVRLCLGCLFRRSCLLSIRTYFGMTGGAAAYRKGASTERMVKKAYEALGCFVIRSPQSGSPIDLTVLWPADHDADVFRTEAVQVKSRGYLRPDEKNEVVALYMRYGCTPVLAWPEKSTVGPIHRRNLFTGKEMEDLAVPKTRNHPSE